MRRSAGTIVSNGAWAAPAARGVDPAPDAARPAAPGARQAVWAAADAEQAVVPARAASPAAPAPERAHAPRPADRKRGAQDRAAVLPRLRRPARARASGAVRARERPAPPRRLE